MDSTIWDLGHNTEFLLALLMANLAKTLLANGLLEDKRPKDLTRPNFPAFLHFGEATFFMTDDVLTESTDLGKELAFEHMLGTRGS